MTGIPDAWGSPLHELLVAVCARAEAHHTAYERGGRPADLDLALSGFTSVLDVAHNVDVRSAAANGLGVALWSRYERSGDRRDLDTAVDLFRDAIAMYPAERTPTLPSFRTNLSGVLLLRWRATGSVDDLTEAVACVREAVADTSPGDRRRSWRLNQLAGGLLTLSLHHDDSSALREAIGLFRQALDCAGEGDDVAGMRSNLAEALRLAYACDGGRDGSLLDEAVTQARAALTAAPDPLLRPRFQSNLALVLLDRHHARRQPDDLADAAALGQAAVAATPSTHPNRAERLLVLSGIRRTQAVAAQRTDRRAVRRMVAAARDAAAAVPDGHPLRADALLAEASALALRGGTAAITTAVATFRRIAADPAAPVRARVTAAWQWARTDPAAAPAAYELAVSLLPRTAPRRVTHVDRERRLASFAGLAGDAAACAIERGDAVGAVRLVEHGRGVLLGQALDARTELTALRAARPDLADRFTASRAVLDRPEALGFSADTTLAALSGEDRHAAASDWDAVLAEIRACPGFERFLAPPSVTELLAVPGPVVVLNAGTARCDALLLADGGVGVLPLACGLDELVGRARDFRAATAFGSSAAGAVIADTLDWLWRVIARPVLAALDPPRGTRVWWVPTGPFTTLPVHAAGPAGGDGVLDRVVSSYAPTVRALVTASPPATRSRPLVVALASTPGAADLPNVPAEAAALTARHPDATVLTGQRATRQAVLAALPEHPWVHFACHAVGGEDGRLLLHDAPLTVTDVARLRLGHADLAYLSACDTGVPAEELGDEALHVAGACHMAGFRHVVATLWAVRDSVAPDVAAAFYAALGESDAAAVALHRAVCAARAAQPTAPLLWAPFVHVGP